MNLYLVTSPLQYLCALEARHHYQTENNILLLVNQKSKTGLAQQNKIVDRNYWDHVITIERSNRSISVPKSIRAIRALIGQTIIERFFYSEYNGWRTKLIVKNLAIDKEVYFDDGTLTILEYYNYILPNNAFYRPRWFQDIITRLGGCTPPGISFRSNNFEIFSMFKLEDHGIPLVKNEFFALKDNYCYKNLHDNSAPIGYIGQGAIGDKNNPSVAKYVNDVIEVAKKTSKKIIYFPHRTEKEEVKTILENHPDIIYHKSEYPLEVEILDKEIKLSALTGAFSTVMFTFNELYPDMPLYTTYTNHPNKAFDKALKVQLKMIGVKPFNTIGKL
ncbi:glycosyltransferase 52 family protein [Vibrio coralliirubri]|uniref:glycosyltransferase 52 family protein n=1 Tax=Vibrio coralliirubri TaxID=1516159 RepID=UPI002FE343CD